MTVDEAVEQAARAGRNAEAARMKWTDTWEQHDESVREDYRAVARAAIRRFLECLVATEEMRIAGADPIGRCGPYETDQDEQDAAFLAWREMSRKLAEEMG